MPRNEQSKSTLRSRQRITNKTRLRVVIGPIDAETVTIGEDDGRGVLHSTQGVEAEDAAEHHLQEVLNASNKAHAIPQKAQRPGTADASAQATPSLQPSTQDHAFIPTPDAQGLVSNYEELYPQRGYEMSYAILKFSETVEESRKFGLNPKSYTMDERDASWLEKWNKQARGEGTSTGPTRRSKTKAATETEDEQLVVIDEDWFELCMGLFENYAAQHLPFLHISQEYPEWSWFESLFLKGYSPTLFASFLVPEGLPPSRELVVMAKGIYPHWLERKTERQGRSIIPDVNLDESDEGNVYVCFRRRELKPIRKTRRMETTSIEKMRRLDSELQSAIGVVVKTIEREDTKRLMCQEDYAIWKFRTRMVSITSKYPDLRSPDDEKWLVDKEKVKKPKPTDALPPLRIPRASASAPQVVDELLDLGSAQMHPRARFEDIQNKIEQDVVKRKERNLLGWEDVTDAPLQSSIPFAQRYFESLKRKEEEDKPRTTHHPSTFRHRVGRGGRRYLDRRMSSQSQTSSSLFTSTPLPNRSPFSAAKFANTFPFGGPSLFPAFTFRMQPWIGFPHANTSKSPVGIASGCTKMDGEDTEELVKKMEERWKFDPDSPQNDAVPATRTIIDDFDHRQSAQRYALIKEREWLLIPDMSRTIVEPRLNLTGPLQDALNSQGGEQVSSHSSLVGMGSSAPAIATATLHPMPTNPQLRPPAATPVGIRPPNVPAGIPQSGMPLARSPSTQQQMAALLLQQQMREKQAAAIPAATQNQAQPSPAQAPSPVRAPTPGQTTQTQATSTPVQPHVSTPAQTHLSGSAQSSPSQATPAPPQASPNPPPQPLTLGGGPSSASVSTSFTSYMNGTSSPPKPMANGYHQSPHPSPRPPMAGLGGADTGTTVRVSTPIRKPTMPLQPNGSVQMNGFYGPAPNTSSVPSSHTGFGSTGMSAGMYHSSQNIKLISQQQQQQQMLAQYQQMQGQMIPLQMQQQHQHFQQQQQQQQQQQLAQQHQLQQLQLMQMQQQQMNGMSNQAVQAHFGEISQNQQFMNMQAANQGVHGQNLFPNLGMTPNTNANSSMNMNMQNVNLQLGPQNMALRLPNRAQQQQGGIPRPPTAMGGDFGMGMANGTSPMMQPMQGMGMNVGGNAQMAAAMSITRAPSTPLSLRPNVGGGLHPNGNMMMARGQSIGPMQSPMMRPTSAASMHSNIGMPMQPAPSLPVSLQGSPANIPQTPHLRQQPVPGS